MGSAMTYTLEQVHSFLLGEAPLDGIWFGENPTHGAMYSWRHHLRKAIQADKAGARVDGNAAQLLREAIPHLRDEAGKYEDDGSNEPLELIRRIEGMLEAAPQPGEVVGEVVATVFMSGKLDALGSRMTFTALTDAGRKLPSGKHNLYIHTQPDAARDADAARWRHVRSTAFREFDSEGMWLRFAAIRHYDGPSDRLNEKFVDSLVDAAMAAGRGEVG